MRPAHQHKGGAEGCCVLNSSSRQGLECQGEQAGQGSTDLAAAGQRSHLSTCFNLSLPAQPAASPPSAPFLPGSPPGSSPPLTTPTATTQTLGPTCCASFSALSVSCSRLSVSALLQRRSGNGNMSTQAVAHGQRCSAWHQGTAWHQRTAMPMPLNPHRRMQGTCHPTAAAAPTT